MEKMITASCKDMGGTDDFVAKGETAYDVKNKMWEHAKMEHKDEMAKMMKMSEKEKKEGMDKMMMAMKCA